MRRHVCILLATLTLLAGPGALTAGEITIEPAPRTCITPATESLVPADPSSLPGSTRQSRSSRLDARVKPGHDESWSLRPGFRLAQGVILCCCTDAATQSRCCNYVSGPTCPLQVPGCGC